MTQNRFNEDALNYDRWRPTYCPELFQTIRERAKLQAGDRLLEIGIGTGQATLPFLLQAMQITALEPGNNLAAVARAKYQAYPALTILEEPFEKAELDHDSFDLIYSATAFHWIEPKLGFAKARQLLKPGKTLALFWNIPTPAKEQTELKEAMQRLYAEIRTNSRPPKNGARYGYAEEAMRDAGFVDLQTLFFESKRSLSSSEYIQLLNTYSDHRALEPKFKEQFEAKIKTLIDQAGGTLTIFDTIECYLGTKPL